MLKEAENRMQVQHGGERGDGAKERGGRQWGETDRVQVESWKEGFLLSFAVGVPCVR